MTTRVDVVIVGAGMAGASAAYALATRGLDVVVLEQFEVGHTHGSSHGASRIFRFAYADRLYVELARRALDGWRALERATSATLVEQTGGADHGDPEAVRGVADALVAAGCDHEVVPAREAARRYPALRFDGDVVLSPDSGRVHADRAVRAFIDAAVGSGATLFEHARVERLEARGERAVVQTPDGAYDATAVVVAAGAWVAPLLRGVVTLPPLVVTEEVVAHFAPRDPSMRWPSFIHHRRGGAVPAYGLVTPGQGVKVAEHHAGRVLDDASQRSGAVDDEAARRIHDYAAEWVPGVSPRALSTTTCLYTTTPNDDFVIDRRGPIVVASPCSGHGFKFAPVIGELVADAVTGAAPTPRFALPV